MTAWAFALALSAGGWGSAEARPPAVFTSTTALEKLRARVGATFLPIEGAEALTRSLDRLRALEAGDDRVLRVLHLGDSHLAADLIAGFVRAKLADRYGDAGRGLVVADQRWSFGGRRTRRKEADWNRPRVVDPRGPGGRFGLFGQSLEATRAGARVAYRLLAEDRKIEVHHEVGPGLGGFSVILDGEVAGRIEGEASAPATRVAAFERAGGPGTLVLVATAPRARVHGLGFETGAPGVLWSAIGPVGADAKVYLQLDGDSFGQSLAHHRPDLVVLMVGGNDALKVRKRWTTLDRVEADHREVVARLRSALPRVEVLLVAPLDAGSRSGGKVRSLAWISDVRDRQRRVARDLGLAFHDLHAAMGGEGSVALWARAGVMAADLVHPRAPAADLVGLMLLEAIGSAADFER